MDRSVLSQTDPVGIIEFRLKPTEEEIAEEQAAQSAAEPEQTLAEEAPAAPDAGSETAASERLQDAGEPREACADLCAKSMRQAGLGRESIG